MKKVFFFCLLGLSIISFAAISCKQANIPVVPQSGKIVAMDLSPAPTAPAIPQTICITQGGGAGEFSVVDETDCRGCGYPPSFSTGPAIVNQAPSQPDTISGTGKLIDCIGISYGCCLINGGFTSYVGGSGNYSRIFSIPSDVSSVSINVRASSGQTTASASINGVSVGSSCSGVYDLNNPPTTGCLAGIGLHTGDNTLIVTDQYISGSGLPNCPGTTYSLCYSFTSSFPTATFTFTSTPTGTLTPSVSPTPTNSSTPTIPPTDTPTFTDTPTGTLSPTVSPTASTTGSPSQTASPSITPSITPTGTPTETATNSPTSTVTPTATATCQGEGNSKSYTPYKQYDATWALTPIDHSNDTIKHSGCLLTCYSMMVGENPGELDATLTADGDLYNTGRMDPMGAAADLGWTLESTVGYSDGNLISALADSDFVIVEVQDGPYHHYIVVTGATPNPTTHQCDFSIQDPGHTRNFLSDYSESARLLVLELNQNN